MGEPDAVPERVTLGRLSIIEGKAENVGECVEPIASRGERHGGRRFTVKLSEYATTQRVDALSVSPLRGQHPHETGIGRRRQPLMLLLEIRNASRLGCEVDADENTAGIVVEPPTVRPGSGAPFHI